MTMVDVVNKKGEKVDSVNMPADVFEVKAPSSLVHEVVTAYLANERRGTHSTKTRGEVSGGGLKPWKQKHTGNARAGSTRSPLWRHGGIIFGPKPRSYYQAVTPSKRRLALRAVLSSYLKEGKLRVVEDLSVAEPKARLGAELLKSLKIGPKSVMVVNEISPTVDRALRNIPTANLRLARDLNSYDVLWSDEVVLTRSALGALSQRLGTETAEVSK